MRCMKNVAYVFFMYLFPIHRMCRSRQGMHAYKYMHTDVRAYALWMYVLKWATLYAHIDCHLSPAFGWCASFLLVHHSQCCCCFRCYYCSCCCYCCWCCCCCCWWCGVCVCLASWAAMPPYIENGFLFLLTHSSAPILPADTIFVLLLFFLAVAAMFYHIVIIIIIFWSATSLLFVPYVFVCVFMFVSANYVFVYAHRILWCGIDIWCREEQKINKCLYFFFRVFCCCSFPLLLHPPF